MVIEEGFKTFFEWLMGPQWMQGTLSTPTALCIAAAILLGLLALMVLAVRNGSRLAASLGAFFLEGVFAITAAVGLLYFGGGVVVALCLRYGQWRPEPGGWGERFTHFLQGIGLDSLLKDSVPVGWRALLQSVDARLTEWFGLSWNQAALLQGIALFCCLVTAAVFVGWLAATVVHGPIRAVRVVHRVLTEMMVDVSCISPRRVTALAWLTFKEAIRRRVIIVFAVFIVLLMFAGWFLNPGVDDPGRLYLSFLLTSATYLVLMLALFLSALSLPSDIKNRTIQTVVTKPVRQSEIVLGRFFGFGVVGSVILLSMCALSYAFVVRGLSHTHQLDPADVDRVNQAVARWRAEGIEPEPMLVRTTQVNRHRHELTLDLARILKKDEPRAAAEATSESAQGHTHNFTYHAAAKDSKDALAYQCTGPEGALQARVPLYGKVSFRDLRGNPTSAGINIGDEWAYRSYIQGGTNAAGVWLFNGIDEKEFPDGLPVEMTISVFRSRKGDIEKAVVGSLAVANPRTGKKVEVRVFPSKEFEVDSQFIPRELVDNDGTKLDLYRDLVDDGKLEVWLQCIDHQQYFGMAQADLYLRKPDYRGAFELNLVKGYVGLWLQMMLLTGFGVAFSTFLSAPIAMLATLGALVGGLAHAFIREVALQTGYGGGPIESFVRLIKQHNVVTELDPGMQTTAIKLGDQLLEFFLWLVSSIVPDFGHFSFSDHVAYGFDVSPHLLGQCLVQAVAVFLPLFILGYLLLKTREVAQ